MTDEKKNFGENTNNFHKKPFNEEYKDYKKRQFDQKQHFEKNQNEQKSSNNVENKNFQKEPNANPDKKQDSQQTKPDTIKISLHELNKLKYQLAEVVNKYRELEREFENYRVRTREDIKTAKQEGATKAIESILPALDSFKKAKQIVADARCKEGICMIEKSILSALEKQNVRPIEAVGKIFNPDFHNAIMTVDKPDVKENTVVEEVEMGFVMGDKVIKYSKVIVAK